MNICPYGNGLERRVGLWNVRLCESVTPWWGEWQICRGGGRGRVVSGRGRLGSVWKSIYQPREIPCPDSSSTFPFAEEASETRGHFVSQCVHTSLQCELWTQMWKLDLPLLSPILLGKDSFSSSLKWDKSWTSLGFWANNATAIYVTEMGNILVLTLHAVKSDANKGKLSSKDLPCSVSPLPPSPPPLARPYGSVHKHISELAPICITHARALSVLVVHQLLQFRLCIVEYNICFPL